MGDQLAMFDAPAVEPIRRAPKPAEVALASVERRKISGKRVKELEGRVIRLLAINPKDWFPHGILVGRDDHAWTLRYFGPYEGERTLTLPRADYMGVEEVDIDPNTYAKRGL